MFDRDITVRQVAICPSSAHPWSQVYITLMIIDPWAHGCAVVIIHTHNAARHYTSVYVI